jgi:hypothetical protein
MSHVKILFLLKQSDVYGNYSSTTSKSGLLNSARITAHQLNKYFHTDSKVEVCKDGNEVDKFVFQFKPLYCIIEAIWVTPAKFKELTRLHPNVHFIVLIHSNIPFLGYEGMAIEWIKEYVKIKRVHVGFNSLSAYSEFIKADVVPDGKADYLPNVYYDVCEKNVPDENKRTIDVGCFGAIRPFKNSLIQCFAAIVFAKKLGMKLNFHINATRPEQGGQSVLKNMIALFAGTENRLIEHEWQDREVFLWVISKMDLCMQVSFSETFNVVSADAVLENVPVIVSSQIDWMPQDQQADLYSVNDMVNKLDYAYHHKKLVAKRNVFALDKYNRVALEAWKAFLNL